MPKKAETLFKEKVMADLKTLEHTWVLKTQETSVRGIPDLIICIRGLFIAVELKASEDQEPDVLQGVILNRIQRAGGVALALNPQNWPETFEELKRYAHCISCEEHTL